jgi:hypothetical protein
VADREWRRLSRESAEIGEKLGITHESAKNLVNRRLKDEEKARLFSKQERPTLVNSESNLFSLPTTARFN